MLCERRDLDRTAHIEGTLLFRSWRSEFPIVDGGGAGRLACAAGGSEIRSLWTPLVTESWLLGTEVFR